jgi:acetyl esterase
MSIEALADIHVEDIEYLRHPSGPLLARIYRPKEGRPRAALVSMHGGRWTRETRLTNAVIDEALARDGALVMALDIRMPPVARYPDCVADINYAIRWLKTRATSLGSRPDLVGVLGVSSGAHQAMLGAMRPADARYAAIQLPAGSPAVDATVRCVVLCWPVIDPLGRFHYAKKLKAAGPPYPDVVDRVLPHHDAYWRTEAAMAEGNPVMALERGEKVLMPPALYVQGTKDVAHPRPDLDRFVAAYRKAGGQVELELYEGATEGFINRNPNSPEAQKALARIIEFVHKEIR